MFIALVAAAALLSAPSMHAQTPQGPPVPQGVTGPDPSRPLPAAEQTVPPGFGSLRQDDLILKLRTPALEIRFMPLDSRVGNLLGTDAYQSLSGLLEANRPRIDSVARDRGVSRPGVAFVSFFGIQAGAFFDADVVAILFRGRLLRPIGVVPYTPQFSGGRLEPRQLVSAFYLFEEQIPVLEPFTLQYSNASADWSSRLQLINRERQKVLARAYRAPTEIPSPAPPPR
jgi:hypothetical protein